MPTAAGFQFTDQDAEIIHYVHQLGLATIDHLADLTGRSHKALERRLPMLREEKYLRRLKGRPHKGLYVIGSKSVPVLISGGYAPQDFADKRRREKEWKNLFLPHRMFISSIHTKLIVLSRQSPIKLIEFRHESPELRDTVQVPGEEKPLPFRPDGFFILRHTQRPAGKDRFPFTLEADIGTMSHKRIESKIKASSAYHQQQKHVSKLGVDHFEVAVITQAIARAENLRAEFYPAMSAAQQRAYHFLPLEELTFEVLLAGIQRQVA